MRSFAAYGINELNSLKPSDKKSGEANVSSFFGLQSTRAVALVICAMLLGRLTHRA